MNTILILIILATLGALDAGYLSYAHLFDSGACGVGSGCGDVMASPYSKLLGIPLSVYGLGLYLAIWVTAWRGFREDDRGDAIRIVSLLAVVGNLPTLFLIYLQAFVIDAWCPFCLVSAALMLAIFVVAWRAGDRRDPGQSVFGPPLHFVVVPIALAIALPVVLYTVVDAGVRGGSPVGLRNDEREVVAHIGDREITLGEMDAAIRMRLQEVKDQYRKEWLDQKVLEVEAESRGLSARELASQEVLSKVTVTKAEIDRRWQEIKGRLKPGTPRADVEPQIRDELAQRRSKPVLEGYVATLKKRFGTVYQPPASERFALDANPRGGPEKGSPDAPVTIVEFSDLECSYCARAHQVVSDLVRRRPKDVRVVFRHYPLAMHAHARHAAEVAACAQLQDGFWKVADMLFGNQKDMSEAGIRKHVGALGLDLAGIDACVKSEDGRRMVQADIDEGDALGVGSTPTFFVNGHYIGSLPREGLDAVVDREMGRD